MQVLLTVLGVIIFGSLAMTMTNHNDYAEYNLPRDCELYERRPNLLDPHSFYWCLVEGPVLMKCVTGTFFNVIVGKCTEEEEIKASPSGTALTEETLKDTRCPQLKSPPRGVKCPPSDPATHSIYHADPDNCECFYQCDNGVAKRIPCWEDLHYNATTRLCDWPEEAGCQAPNGYKYTHNQTSDNNNNI